jgi:hypothetical protein
MSSTIFVPVSFAACMARRVALPALAREKWVPETSRAFEEAMKSGSTSSSSMAMSAESS